MAQPGSCLSIGLDRKQNHSPLSGNLRLANLDRKTGRNPSWMGECARRVVGAGPDLINVSARHDVVPHKLDRHPG